MTGIKGLADLAQLTGLVVTPSKPEVAAAQTASTKQGFNDPVRVHTETKGRGGKAVTLVKGISLPLHELEALGKQLKVACGSGGTVKDGVIEVQGDHADRLVVLLIAQGYKAKRAGGKATP